MEWTREVEVKNEIDQLYYQIGELEAKLIASLRWKPVTEYEGKLEYVEDVIPWLYDKIEVLKEQL